MEQALPLFILLGIIVVALALALLGIFLGSRSRNTGQQAQADDLTAPTYTSTKPSSESISIYLEPDGAISVEMEGQRFSRLEDIGDNRLVNQVMAATSRLQQFAGVTPTALEPASSDLSDVLRVGHAATNKALVVEFRGQRYQKLTDIRDGETGRQVLAIIGELVAFAQGIVLPAETLAPPQEPSGPPEDEFLKQLVTPASGPAPARPPTLIGALERAVASKAVPAPIGLAGHIDQVLQDQLVDNAALLGRSIHLATAPDGSLVVQVDGVPFHWPDGVSDADVRAAVQRAIQKWERTTEL